MTDIFELAKNAISKNLIIFKVFSEKIFELSPDHWFLDFKTIIILGLLLNQRSKEKLGGKIDLVGPISLSSFKVIFILLAKLIAI